MKLFSIQRSYLLFLLPSSTQKTNLEALPTQGGGLFSLGGMQQWEEMGSVTQDLGKALECLVSFRVLMLLLGYLHSQLVYFFTVAETNKL